MLFSLIIVDDDELIKKGLEKVISWQELGFHVVATFSSALDAYDYLKNNEVDVILTDVKMPKMTGLELIDKARQINSKCKAVIISGFNEFELLRNAMLLKVEDYLLKPLSQEDVEGVFKRLFTQMMEENTSNDKNTDYSRLQTLIKEKSAFLISRIEDSDTFELEKNIESIINDVEYLTTSELGFFCNQLLSIILEYFKIDKESNSFNKGDYKDLSHSDIARTFQDDVKAVFAVFDRKCDINSRIILTKAKAIINDQYKDKSLSLQKISEELDISYGYLSSLFKKIEGISFKAFLTNIRMEEARKYLLSRKYKIYEIADAVGFSDARYFTESFHKYYGCSPSEYLQNLRKWN